MENETLIYCDASYDRNYHKTIVSVAVFTNGQLIYEESLPKKNVRNSFEAEFYAIKYSVIVAKKLKVKNCTIFSDGRGNISAIQYKSPPKYKKLVNEIKKHSTGLNITYEWIPRSKNTYADRLGKRKVKPKDSKCAV